MLKTTVAICLFSIVTGLEFNSTWEDDIIRDPIESHNRFARQAETKRVWTNALIPISFNSAYPEKQKASAIDGMKIWEANTCVKFRQNDATSANRAEIINGGSCQSYVGMYGGRQTVILGPSCNGISTTAHELGHAIGLQHMQTRSDRDSYVTLQTSNIDKGAFDLNFKIEATASTMDVPYDITSIMHYQPYDSAMNSSVPSIVPKSMFSEYTKCMGNYMPSFYDYLRVNRLYKCDQKCASYRTVCSNNGVMDVNNCNQCLCPAGWGGKTCTENPSGTEVKTATANWQQISTKIGNPQDDQLPHYTFKHFVINAPTNRKVEVKIDYMWAGFAAGCKFGGIEIFEKVDTRITPPRVCQMADAKSVYRSPNTRMYIRLYNRFSQLTANMSYRYIVKMLKTTAAICLLSIVSGLEFNSTWEDDIIRDPIESHNRFARQAETKRVWTNALIPISFNSAYPEKQKASAIAGMKIWEANTCVRFRQNDATSANRAEIINGGSCQSYVGMYGGRQTVILGPACNGISTSAHELGHAIGLQHMQTRSDRDSYVTLQTSNINNGTFDLNFKVEATASTMDVPYDITSIMHYQPYDFAMNPSVPSIVPKSMFSEYTKCMGNYMPSFYDYLRVNRLYKCDQKCASYRTVCSNNGVMDVNNCNQCLCPAGWGGKTCTENPAGSEVKTATANWQQISTTIGNPQDDQLPEFTFKHFVINAPTNRKVEVKIDYMWAGDSAGCKFGGIEIFEKVDTRITPPRVCKLADAKSVYRSPNTRMYIRVYNRFSQLTANMSYRYI